MLAHVTPVLVAPQSMHIFSTNKDGAALKLLETGSVKYAAFSRATSSLEWDCRQLDAQSDGPILQPVKNILSHAKYIKTAAMFRINKAAQRSVTRDCKAGVGKISRRKRLHNLGDLPHRVRSVEKVGASEP